MYKLNSFTIVNYNNNSNNIDHNIIILKQVTFPLQFILLKGKPSTELNLK